MKKILICFCLFTFLTACEAGKLTPDRERLHTMGQTEICEKNPDRCIDGTNIPW